MNTKIINQPLGKLRVVAFLEGCSFLLFAITMPLKYMYQITGPNKVIGMAHGILFMLYVAMVFKAAYDNRWSYSKTGWALLASVVPFGTFYADKKLFR